jgi:ABC-2 type transport system permease protein
VIALPHGLELELRGVLIEVRWQLRRRRRVLAGWALALAAVAGVYIPFYPALGGEELQLLVSSLPPELVSALGYDRIGTPAGYLTSTIFGLLAPVLMLVFAVGLGAHSVAGLEEDGLLELAAAAPVSRRALLAGRAIAMHTQLASLTLVVLVMTWGLSMAVGLEVTFVGIVAASVGLQLLACAFGTITLAAGAASGRRAVALTVGSGLAVIAFVADALSGLVGDGELLATISPFAWYLGGDPVAEGFAGNLAGLAGLAVLTFVAWATAQVGLLRRDLGV